MCEIERTLGRGAGIPHIRHSKGKAEGHKREIEEILGTLNASSSHPEENPSMGEIAPHLAPVGLDHSVMTAVSESGTPFVILLPILYRILIFSILLPHLSVRTFDQTRIRSA